MWRVWTSLYGMLYAAIIQTASTLFAAKMQPHCTSCAHCALDKLCVVTLSI